MDKFMVVVDDNTQGLEMFTLLVDRLAPQFGLEITMETFRSGHALLATLGRGDMPPIDLILLDYDMPTTSGDEICAELRERGLAETIILLYSAHQDDTRKEKARAAGADGFAEKEVRLAGEQFRFFLSVLVEGAFPAEPPVWLTLFERATKRS